MMSLKEWWKGEPHPLVQLVKGLLALEYAKHNMPPPTDETLISDILAQLKEWGETDGRVTRKRED
jgi:hypothetical protein